MIFVEMALITNETLIARKLQLIFTSMSGSEDRKSEEYRSLLEEHRMNRVYIFERPIIILGLAGVATQYFYKSSIGQLILAALIFLLCYNLWFVGNRLQSDARIVAYLQLVHEGELSANWFGWESALREYRRWTRFHIKKGDLDNLIKSATDFDVVPDGLLFFPAIAILHTVMALVAFCAALIRWSEYRAISENAIIENVSMFAAILAMTIFLFYALGPLYPNKLRASIENERAKWKSVFLEISERS